MTSLLFSITCLQSLNCPMLNLLKCIAATKYKNGCVLTTKFTLIRKRKHKKCKCKNHSSYSVSFQAFLIWVTTLIPLPLPLQVPPTLRTRPPTWGYEAPKASRRTPELCRECLRTSQRELVICPSPDPIYWASVPLKSGEREWMD